MTHGWKWLWLSAALVVTGCANAGKLDIRPVGQQAAAADEPVSLRLAMAQGHLALGNVALALEEFRRAVREEPQNVLALAGMARCYEAMGRFDLTRRYYEQALSIAPRDASLSLALAASLDSQGQAEAARSLRLEVAARSADQSAPSVTIAGSVVELPTPVASIAPPISPARTDTAPRASLTIAMPPPRVAATKRAALRLERLSSGEVALITSDQSPWIARKVAATSRSVTIRFDKRETMVVLNAARVAGIAARTRDYLAKRGFAATTIGDAPATRRQTLIRYPAAARARAERIAAQFPFSAKLEPSAGPLTLLVGRDAAPRRGSNAG